MDGRLDWIDRALDAIASDGRLRALAPVRPRSAVRVEVDGRDVTLFSSNDYLGLSCHPAVRAAAAHAAGADGMGPRSASLICGYTDEHAALETDLADLAGTESALLFPTGFAANAGVLAALGTSGATIFSDERNHASIIDGCRLAKADVRIYRHADAGHLDALLAECRSPRRIVVTDTVFSMDGDVAPLADLAEVCERHGAVFVTDEAHATLVLGTRGSGAAEAAGVADRVDVHVGTLSKAVGAQGGFVATSARIRAYLLNVARPYVFTTAPSLPVVAAARAALRVVRDEPEIRRRLVDRMRELGAGLGRALATPIAPVVVGGEAAALEASRRLLERGFHVTAIRPPTVPPGSSRLRITVSAAHEPHDVAGFVAALRASIDGAA